MSAKPPTRRQRKNKYTSKAYRRWDYYLRDKYFPNPFMDSLTIQSNSEGFMRKFIRMSRGLSKPPPSPQMADYLQREAAFKAEHKPYNNKNNYAKLVPVDWKPHNVWTEAIERTRTSVNSGSEQQRSDT